MIPASSWLTLLIDAMSQYAPSGGLHLSRTAEESVLSLISEIQADAQAHVIEGIQEHLLRHRPKEPL